MLKELILKARRKPKHVRDNIAFGIAGSITAAICLVWLVVMPGQLAKKTTSVNDDHKVFSTFFNQLKDQVAGVKESMPDVQATTTAATVTASEESTITELTATSSDWSLSSSTIKNKSIQKEVPIIIINSGSSSASTSPTEPNR